MILCGLYLLDFHLCFVLSKIPWSIRPTANVWHAHIRIFLTKKSTFESAEIKLGSCPTPNGWRKETSCSNNLPCLNDKGCDLDQKCCPDYNGHMDLSCRSTCQDPKFPVQLSCSRTKPFWLGLVQGSVTAIRLWIFHAIFSERYVTS